MATKKPAKSTANTSADASTNKTKASVVKARATAARTRARGAAKGQVGGFVNFLRTQGVVGLAVGLAIGTAAGDTVRKLVEGFINPIVQFIIGSQEGLQTAVWHVELWGRKADFAWGAFVSSAITLLATAFVIYLIVHFAKFDRLDKKKDA